MKTSLPILLVAIVGIIGCSSNSGPSPGGSGAVAGRVILFDSTGTVLTDFSRISVSVDGISTSMVTNSFGDWQFAGLANGTYNISATKTGFGTFHWYEQNINNGRTDLGTAGLGQMPSYTPTISSVSYGIPGNDSTNPAFITKLFLGGISYLPAGINVEGYCDLDSNVQPSDSHLMVSSLLASGSFTGSLFTRSDLLAAGARPGQTLYFSAANVLIAKGWTVGYQTTFVDPSHNNEIRYASNGPKSNVVTFTMP